MLATLECVNEIFSAEHLLILEKSLINLNGFAIELVGEVILEVKSMLLRFIVMHYLITR